jgi:hypothetical protein
VTRLPPAWQELSDALNDRRSRVPRDAEDSCHQYTPYWDTPMHTFGSRETDGHEACVYCAEISSDAYAARTAGAP